MPTGRRAGELTDARRRLSDKRGRETRNNGARAYGTGRRPLPVSCPARVLIDDFHHIRHLTAPPPPRFVCLGAPLATCALPKGDCYLLTYLGPPVHLVSTPLNRSQRLRSVEITSGRISRVSRGLWYRVSGRDRHEVHGFEHGMTSRHAAAQACRARHAGHLGSHQSTLAGTSTIGGVRTTIGNTRPPTGTP